jgi:xanthine/uracil permease
MELEQCRDSLNTLVASLPAIVFAAAVMVLFVILAAAAVKRLNGSTLISLKVELLD